MKGPAMATKKELHQLAVAIVRRQREELQRNNKAPYYMLNIGHPALRELWKQYRAHAAPAICPVSDAERIAWELSLLNDEALKAIEKEFGGPCTNEQICQLDRK